MFNNLLESKAKKQRSIGATLTSFIINGSLIVLGVYATAHAAVEAEKPKEEKIDFVEMKKEEPPPPKNEPPPPPPPQAVAAPPTPKGFQVPSPPLDIPDVIPKVDLSKKVIDEADFTGKGVQGGSSKGDPNIKTAPIIDDKQTYFDFQVEKQAQSVSVSPRFPSALNGTGVEGQVVAQFVVDENGRADMSTFKVIKSDNDLFTQAVKDALRNGKFLPAEVGGRKVKQLVQQAFTFQTPR